MAVDRSQMISGDQSRRLAEATFSSVNCRLDDLKELVVDLQRARAVLEEKRKDLEHSMPGDHDEDNRAYDASDDNRTDM